MGWTLNSLKTKLGQARIDNALADTAEWMPKGYPAVCEYVRDNWTKNPRATLKGAYAAMAFAGVKSHADKYLVVAKALGKLD